MYKAHVKSTCTCATLNKTMLETERFIFVLKHSQKKQKHSLSVSYDYG